MPAVTLSPVGGVATQFFNNSGVILSGGKLYTYSAGTTTSATTYTTSAGNVAHTNPIILDSAGRVPGGQIWLPIDSSYKFVVNTSTNVLIGTYDNVSGANAATVSYIPAGTGAVATTVQTKLRESVSVFDFMTAAQVSDVKAGTATVDVTSAIQAALNAKGRIYLPPGTYRITSTLTVYGDTELFGAGLGVSILKWYGATSGRIIQDSSYVTSSYVNLNIILRDFEVNGNAYASNTLSCIGMYRVGKTKYERLYLHDVGANLLQWGLSQTDTVDIQVIGCIFERCYNGDATQGVGTRVIVRDCYAFSAGDTCYALLYDSNATTNPSNLYSSNVVFDNCIAKGEYNASGTFTGTGRVNQLGFAFGPFNVSINAYITVNNCLCENLYQNCWFIVFNKLKLIGNTFKSAANLLTGGVRLDGVNNAIINGNFFENSFASASTYYSSLFLNAQRNTFGASTFDASNKYTVINGNTFEQNSTPAVIFAVDPTYSVVVSDVVASNNEFAGVTLPFQFKPLTGSGTNIFQNININGNTVNSTATTFATVSGAGAQYSNVTLAENNIGSIAPLGGTAAAWDNFLVAGSNLLSVSAADGVTTTVFTMPSAGYNQIQVQSSVRAASVAYTAVATLASNAGVPKILWQQNGANCTLTLVGNAVRVTQSGIGTQTVYTSVKYLT